MVIKNITEMLASEMGRNILGIKKTEKYHLFTRLLLSGLSLLRSLGGLQLP